MANINFVYRAKTFVEKEQYEDLFKRLEEAGYNIDDVLFESTMETPSIDYDSVISTLQGKLQKVSKDPKSYAGDFSPKDLEVQDLQAIGANLGLTISINKGREALDGLLECPRAGRVLLMYDRTKLHPFVPKGLEEHETLETTNTYYAKTVDELAEAMIGAVKFV